MSPLARSVRGKKEELTSSDKKDRPLDCWREVETFKAEVAKLEQVSPSFL